ncbi:MAG TPA: DUF2510 domain-containing protein [Acidimicrobiales bacterium]|nr:DUF2510 domain-containing protein [Acidimicrobiales bacterium]
MAATTVSRRPGPSLVVALTVIAIGVVCAVPCLVLVGTRVQRTLESSSLVTPGQASRHLSSGTWFIYQQTATRSGFGGVSFSSQHPTTLQPGDVTVTGPRGQVLPVSYVTVDDTITQQSGIYTAVVQFDVPSSGTYSLMVTTPSSRILVARSLGDTFKGVVGFVLVGVAGGLLTAVGVVLLIVGIVRRSHAESRALAPAWGAAAAGWYPDATQGGRMRWWDGSRWSDHFG